MANQQRLERQAEEQELKEQDRKAFIESQKNMREQGEQRAARAAQVPARTRTACWPYASATFS